MNKICKVLICAGMVSSLLTGCQKNEVSYSDVQQKIEKAGWKIHRQIDNDTKTDHLTITVDQDHVLDLSQFNGEDTIQNVGYRFTAPETTFSINYQLSDKKDYAIAYGFNNHMEKHRYCVNYNLTDDNEDEVYRNVFDCSDDTLDMLKSTQNERDTLLSDHDLTLDELYHWAEWYKESN